MKIKELPCMERPYEKLEAFGAEKLSTAELLAIIIKSGTKDLTSVEIAQMLLKEDTLEEGINFLRNYSLEELELKKGIGRVKAIQLKALSELCIRANKPNNIIKKKVSTPEDIAKIMMIDYAGANQEMIKTILLDNQNQIIKIVTNAIGGLTSASVEAREIFKEPIKVSASKIVLVHNHPSGDVTPSASDVSFTKQIMKAGFLIGIEVIDHIIIGNSNFLSLKRMKKV